MGIVFRIVFFTFVAPFISAWSMMITLGIVHADIAEVVWPVGYGPCLGISFLTCLVALIFGLVNAGATLADAATFY